VSCCHIDVVRGSIILIFGFGGRDAADGLQQPTMVVPVDPFERGVLDGFEAAPRSARADHFGFIEAVDRFGQSVVVAVADTADRWLDGGLGKALGILDRHVLRPTVAMMDQAATVGRTAIVERLFERIQDGAGVRRPSGAPAYNPSGVGIDDEGDVDEPCPGRDVEPALAEARVKSETQSLFGACAKNWRLT